MKMSDVFELPVCCSIEDKMGGGECITFDTPYHNLSDAHGSAVDVAINNYDRMADEIAELRAKITKKDEMASDLAEALCASVDEISEFREMLKKHKEFNEHMHEMPPEWTVKRSIELHKETIELLYSNNK